MNEPIVLLIGTALLITCLAYIHEMGTFTKVFDLLESVSFRPIMVDFVLRSPLAPFS